jgi:uncharacterized membrane protein YqjE
MEQHKTSIGKIFSGLFHSIKKLGSDLSQLAHLEAKLAKQSLVNLIILALVLGGLLTTTWLCLLGLLVTYLMSIQFSLLAALGIATLLNLILLAIVGLVMLKLKNNLFFPATRRQLNNTKKLLKETYHARITAKN